MFMAFLSSAGMWKTWVMVELWTLGLLAHSPKGRADACSGGSGASAKGRELVVISGSLGSRWGWGACCWGLGVAGLSAIFRLLNVHGGIAYCLLHGGVHVP